MSEDEQGEWIRQGTPHQGETDWEEGQSDYGTTLSPAEWDDYVSEQSVPVEPPRPRPRPSVVETTSESATDSDEIEAEQDIEPGQQASEPAASEGEDSKDSERPAEEEDSAEEAAGADVEDDASDEAAVASEPPEQRHDDTEIITPPEPETAQGEEELTQVLEEGTRPEVDSETPELADLEREDQTEPAVDALDDDGSEEEPTDADSAAWDAHQRSSAGQDALTSEIVFEEEVTDPEEVAGDGADAQAEDGDPDGISDGGSWPPEETTSVFRDQPAEETQVLQTAGMEEQDGFVSEEEAEERRQQEELEAARQARDERLGVVPTSPENERREVAAPAKPTTDRFFPSFGLFVLRLITGAIVGVIGYQVLSNLDATVDLLAQTVLPEPRLLAWITGFLLLALALLLLVGLLQRVVGFLLLVVSAISLSFLRWGPFSPFVAGVEGFRGDRDLLLAAVGLILLCLGGGLWGIDGAFRRSRAKTKATRDD